jgi:hypothetical protein
MYSNYSIYSRGMATHCSAHYLWAKPEEKVEITNIDQTEMSEL